MSGLAVLQAQERATVALRLLTPVGVGVEIAI